MICKFIKFRRKLSWGKKIARLFNVFNGFDWRLECFVHKPLIFHPFIIKNFTHISWAMILSHYNCAIKAITKGKHIFIEKPITTTCFFSQLIAQVVMGVGMARRLGKIQCFRSNTIWANDMVYVNMRVQKNFLVSLMDLVGISFSFEAWGSKVAVFIVYWFKFFIEM